MFISLTKVIVQFVFINLDFLVDFIYTLMSTLAEIVFIGLLLRLYFFDGLVLLLFGVSIETVVRQYGGVLLPGVSTLRWFEVVLDFSDLVCRLYTMFVLVHFQTLHDLVEFTHQETLQSIIITYILFFALLL